MAITTDNRNMKMIVKMTMIRMMMFMMIMTTCNNHGNVHNNHDIMLATIIRETMGESNDEHNRNNFDTKKQIISQ